jgi:hypothetical protein
MEGGSEREGWLGRMANVWLKVGWASGEGGRLDVGSFEDICAVLCGCLTGYVGR